MPRLLGVHHCAMFPSHDQAANRRGFLQCKLNPGHENFLTVEEFRKKTPSDLCLTPKDMTEVWNVVDRTVRVVVSRTSPDRPSHYSNSTNSYPCADLRGSYNWARYGTGFLVEGLNIGGELVEIRSNEPCACIGCRSSICQRVDRERFYFKIITATHVIYDEKEANCAVFEFFYDSEDRHNVEVVYGVTLLGASFDRFQTDKCHVVCVTHDGRLAARLSEICSRKRGMPMDFLVSHPHGVSKRISMGKFLENRFVLVHNKSSVRITKGVAVGFHGCEDANRIVRCINHALSFPNSQRVIEFIKGDSVGDKNATKLLCDVIIHFPESIVVESDVENDLSFSTLETKQWWRLQPGVELEFVADDGKRPRIMIPHTQNEAWGGGRGVMMELFMSGRAFCDEHDVYVGRACGLRLFVYSTYDMASCPGSSGALIYSHFRRYQCFRSRGKVHFGTLGQGVNTSGLDRPRSYRFFHTPRTT